MYINILHRAGRAWFATPRRDSGDLWELRAVQPEERVILGHWLEDDDDDGVDVEDDVDDVSHGWEHHLQLGLLLRRRHLRIEFINNAAFPKGVFSWRRNKILLRIAGITHQFQHLFSPVSWWQNVFFFLHNRVKLIIFIEEIDLMPWWQPGPRWRWPRQHLSKVDCSPIPSGAPTKDREDSQLWDCWSDLFSFELIIIIIEEQLTGTVNRFRRFDTISGPTLRKRKVRNKSHVMFTRTNALILAIKVYLPWRLEHVVTQDYFIGIGMIAVSPFCLSVISSTPWRYFVWGNTYILSEVCRGKVKK